MALGAAAVALKVRPALRSRLLRVYACRKNEALRDEASVKGRASISGQDILSCRVAVIEAYASRIIHRGPHVFARRVVEEHVTGLYRPNAGAGGPGQGSGRMSCSATWDPSLAPRLQQVGYGQHRT